LRLFAAPTFFTQDGADRDNGLTARRPDLLGVLDDLGVVDAGAVIAAGGGRRVMTAVLLGSVPVHD